ncbi:MAG TPA: phosphate-starvation-inducible E-like protein [Bacteroidales bacterium]|nr:phosphate-starvation-inducible E-like protein [Bacteroidales bacterium]
MLDRIFHHFERIIVLILLALMGLIITISTFELSASIIDSMINNKSDKGYMSLNISELLELFSFILLIVIGLELFETIKYYLNKHIIQAEFILLVALTAIARKVIVLDYSKADERLLLGIAATIIALSTGYFLIKRADARIKNP